MKKLFFLIGLFAFVLLNTSPIPPDHDVGLNAPTDIQFNLDSDSQTSVVYSAVLNDLSPSYSVETEYSYAMEINTTIDREVEVIYLFSPVEKGLNQVCTTQLKSNFSHEEEYNIKGPISLQLLANYKTPILRYTKTHIGTINRFV